LTENLFNDVIESDERIYNKEFILETDVFEEYLVNLKQKFDSFDEKHESEEDRLMFLMKKKKQAFSKFDKHSKKIYEMVEEFSDQEYQFHKKYYQSKLGIMILSCDFFKHIYDKPLGYAGDFRLINFIYDNYDKIRAGTTFNQLLQQYSGQMPITLSNVERKTYFKKKVMGYEKSKKKNIKIASIVCGPAREIIEPIHELMLKKNYKFHLLDFEPRALDHILIELKKVNQNLIRNIEVNLIHEDVLAMIRGKNKEKDFKDFDFIYSLGLFDYLRDKMASRLISALFSKLAIGGTLIVTNANEDTAYHRPYYELLAEWTFFHRSRDTMLTWLKPIRDEISDVSFEVIPHNGYHFMVIKK